MPYRLKHKEHGVTNVYDLAEVERHKQWGWEMAEAPAMQAGSVDAKPANVAADAPIVRKKPGPKPKAK